MRSNRHVALPLLSVFIIALASSDAKAQNTAGSTAGDPAEASAPVPATIYRSALSSYRGFREEEVANWRETNDTVGTIGGWRAYLREAQQEPVAPPSTTPPAASPPAKPLAQGMSPDMQQHMKEKMQGMSPEMQKKMQQKMQGMSPQMQQQMKEKMMQGTRKDDPAPRGAVPPGAKDPQDAHQNH